MKVFQLTQKNFAIVGITSNWAIKSQPFNWKIFTCFSVLGSSIICSLMYILFEADTLNEYTQSIYSGSMTASIILSFMLVIINVKKMFQLIDICEDIVNTSELKTKKIGVIMLEFKFVQRKFKYFLFSLFRIGIFSNKINIQQNHQNR